MTESNIKYTTSGDKVIVVGKLNNQETIVQKIYISNGNEIPAGENFVVKSLLDHPAVSWKEKQIKELEDRYEKAQKQYKTLQDSLYLAKEKLSKKIQDTQGLEKLFSVDKLKPLFDFLAGDIKYIVIENWDRYDIKTLEEMCYMDENRFKAFRLISLFGNSEGDLLWRVGQYYDNSGSSTQCFPFSNKEDAIEFVKKSIKEKIKNATGNKDYLIKDAMRHGVEIDNSILDEYLKRLNDGAINYENERIKDINNNRKRVEYEMAVLEKYKQSMNSL